MVSSSYAYGKRAGALLLVGTMLSGWGAPLLAQETPPAETQPAPTSTDTAPATTAPATTEPATTAPATTAPATTQPAPVAAQPVPAYTAPASGTIRSIAVRGAERLEPETVRSYANLQPGQTYSTETLDTALKDLYATELFADVVITGADTGNLVITVRENPVINRIILEGNRRIKADKINPEIRLAPRQIFTRSKARADVERIIELYKRSGRFAASVEPKVVQLEQNRVDLVFEINEGPVSKVRAINIIGNDTYSDGRLRKEMFTREAGGILGILRSNDTYDPDRLAADQQKLRAFYLTEGYADFRVVSALAELTPDRRDFVITYVVEEGPRYKFGSIDVESNLRDLNPEVLRPFIGISQGDWFDAKAVEDIVTSLNEVAGAQGYAFADVSPAYDRDAEARTMSIRFRLSETPRVYVERIDVNGNTVTRDKVIRREFRINEGDAFNALKIRRSQERIQSLGFFQENIEIKQTQGSAPDRVVLGVDVEEKSTGELQLSAGYSSLERFIVSASIAQRNFMGKGQEVSAGVNWSRYSRSVNLGFTEPQLFDKNVLLGGEIYRRDYNSFNYSGNNDRRSTYSQVSTGAGLRMGFPLTEFMNFGTRYSLVQDKVELDEGRFFSDLDDDGVRECDPLLAGRYLCDELGTRLSSVAGYSVIFDNRNSLRATRGQRLVLSQDFAGLGGDVRYVRTRLDATKYLTLPKEFILSIHGEGGYIHPLEGDRGPGRDAIRLSDRFFGAQMRGFDIRGIGPRVRRIPYDLEGNLVDIGDDAVTDALGGRAYYLGRVELEIPVSANIRNLGLRPSAFVDVGSVWALDQPRIDDFGIICTPISSATGLETEFVAPGGTCAGPGFEGPPESYIRQPGYKEEFLGNSPKPRLSIGVGVNWISPFGPLRIDIAKALLKQEGDETKFFSFNVGTQF